MHFIVVVTVSEVEALHDLFRKISNSVVKDNLIHKVVFMHSFDWVTILREINQYVPFIFPLPGRIPPCSL